MHALETYLRRLRDIHATGAGTRETSYYAPLEDLLNRVGHGLGPRVLCVSQLADRGAGRPDGGLYTAAQLQRDTAQPLPGQLPERGVVEVKAPGEDLDAIVQGRQVSRYWDRYRQVLVTNYRQFAFVGQNEHGQAVVHEAFTLAHTEAAFWQVARDPHAFATDHGDRFEEFLRRVLRYAAPLAAPEDVAWFLASYAREARLRLEQADLERLDELRTALEEVLGLHFSGEKGDRFFRATVIQTLFYGIFSAWVLWHREHPTRTDNFIWHSAAYYLRVPMMQVLFGHMALPYRVQRLDLVDVLNRTAAVLNRVDRAVFFARFDEHDAIQYFYEPFLEAFDPALRRELGVWYTPREVVRYMVRRVDDVLRRELHVADGLADPQVVVLDPCCGTGAYLVAVLEHIAESLRARGEEAMTGIALKDAATGRLFGFELLTAPFVVAHLQLGLFLREQGVPLAEDERAGVFLTNALTGWKPAAAPQAEIFPELAEERAQADAVKQQAKVLVILGNPPYSGFSGIAVDEERELTEAYRTTVRAPEPKGQGLNDLYVRFFRMAERQIVEETGRGVVCFISNYSWLDGLSHPGMRERYLDAFDHVWIDSLNGDKYRTGKLTPDGQPDPSIFSTKLNREGIQVGTAVALLVRRDGPHGTAAVHFRDLWGKEKLAQLDAEARGDAEPAYQAVYPPPELGFPFMPRTLGTSYLSWPKLPELFPASFPGVKTSRDSALVDIDRERLVARIEQYLDPTVTDEEVQQRAPALMESTQRFDAPAVRAYLVKRPARMGQFIRYCYRPFDVRWLYWEPETKLLDEKRPDYFRHLSPENVWLSAAQRNRKDAFYQPLVTKNLADHHIFESNAGLFPLYLAPEARAVDLFSTPAPPDAAPRPNLSAQARAYLEALYGPETPPALPPHEALFYHTVAVLHAPAYRTENAGALRQDWPRVPLSASATALDASATLGRRVAALLDVEQPVEGVTAGTVDPLLRGLGAPTHAAGRQLDPAAGHFDVTAGWGFAGKGGVTMPGKGRTVERPYTPAEYAALPDTARPLLGETTFDVYLNDDVYWRNVPARVWDYTLGGYAVLKKWLSYRETALLGRALTPAEVRHVTQAVRRIAALLLLEPALDAAYATLATPPPPEAS